MQNFNWNCLATKTKKPLNPVAKRLSRWRRISVYFLAWCIAGVSAVHAQTVRIGAPLALTGGLADEGKKQQAAYMLWLERVNAAGGITVGGKKMKVELVVYDYQTSEQRALQLAEKLITDDKVHFMTAPFGSGHTKVVAGVAERYGVPVIAVASAEPVHNQGYKNLFGTLAPSGGLVDSMYEYVRERAWLAGMTCSPKRWQLLWSQAPRNEDSMSYTRVSMR